MGDARGHSGETESTMTLALVRSRALRGLDAPAVTVEVHLASGLPSFTLVGLADTEVKESRERVRAALQTSPTSTQAPPSRAGISARRSSTGARSAPSHDARRHRMSLMRRERAMV
jgi:hypothetical protein